MLSMFREAFIGTQDVDQNLESVQQSIIELVPSKEAREQMYTELEKDTEKLRNSLEISLDNLSQAFTQVKEYQTEIEEAREFWRLTFDAVEAPIAILDNQSHIIKANKAFLESVEVSLNYILGRTICDAFCNETYKNAAPCKEGCEREHIIRNDKLYKIKFNKIYDHSGHLKGCVFVAHDITEEKAAQDHLEEVTAKYKSIFESAYDAIILLEVESRKIIEANLGAVRIYGYRQQDFPYMTALDLSAEPEKTGAALDVHTETVALRFHRRKDGIIIPVEISAAYYEHAHKNYCVCIIRDISDKISNEALNQCLQKLLIK
jgi:PAS domain S-box-containing protein